MNISFKFLTFCLITMLLITSYRVAIHARVTTKPATSPSLIRQGNIQAPKAGQSYQIKDLFALINTNDKTNKRSNFIITADGKNSYRADNFGFNKIWAQNNKTIVRLTQDEAQVKALEDRGVLPNASILNRLKGNASKAQIYKLVKHISDNFPKIMLYFNAISPTDGKTYKLYITDPCPGKTKWNMVIQGRLNPQTNIPAYTHVLSKWKVK